MFQFIRAHNLEQWANRSEAQSRFPVLIRWLIQATSGQLRELKVSGDDAVNIPGWDGVSHSITGGSHVPTHLAVWEFSTGRDVIAYANENFNKRTANPLGVNSSETTFVFVTPRRFSSPAAKENWVQEKTAIGAWKEVLAYDVDDLVAWLEVAPGVSARFAKEMGLRPPGIQSLELFLQEYCSSTIPEITTDLLRLGRDYAIQGLQDWLQGTPRVLTLKADEIEEAIAVIGAAIRSLPPKLCESLLSRAVLVSTQEAWEEIIVFQDPLILIPRFDKGKPRLGGVGIHHVLLPVAPSHFSSEIEILKTPEEEFIKALGVLGLPEEKSKRLVRESAGRLSIFRRLMDKHGVAAPDWANLSIAPFLAPLSLVGSWDESNKSDCQVVEAICGRSYREIVESLVSWIKAECPFAAKVDSVWSLISRAEAWRHLEPYLTTEQLKTFFNRAEDVLREIDPRYTLEPSDRFMAKIKGKIPKYSVRLKSSLAETLAIMGSRGSNAIAYESRRPQDWVDRFFYKFFEQSDQSRFWFCVGSELNKLAEASPDRFLAVLESDLRRAAPKVPELFEDEGSMGGCNHAELLWALETLAWRPEYLGRVALYLAELNKHFPGSSWAHSPMKSLNEIFLLWRRNTLAIPSERVQVIDTLIREHPEQAWGFLCALLPQNHSTSFGTHKPKWRTWLDDLDSDVIVHEHRELVDAVTERLPKLCGNSGKRWGRLLKNLNYYPFEKAKHLLTDAQECSTRMSPEDRFELWCEVRKLLNKHKSFRDADWAFPDHLLDLLSSLYDSLVPDDPVRKFAWIFDYNPDFPLGQERDWHARQEEVRVAQHKAASEIIPLGFETVLAVANEAKTPGLLGALIASSGVSEQWEPFILCEAMLCEKRRLNFTSGFAVKRFEDCGWDWLREYLPFGKGLEWSSNTKISLLRVLPYNPKTWDFVAECGSEVENAYWKSIPTRVPEDAHSVPTAIKMFLKHKRPWNAIDTASLYLSHQRSPVPEEILIEILRTLLMQDLGLEENKKGILAHQQNIADVLEAISESPSVNREELAQLEWAFMPILSYNRRHPLVLHKWMAENPEFFLEIISYSFREEGKSLDPVSDGQSAKASLAYEVLSTWKTMPGIGLDGKLDDQTFKDWTGKVLNKAKEVNRQAITKVKVGEVLALSTEGVDGFWPHESVRDVLEQNASDELFRGFFIGKIRLRGSTTRALDTGGAPERSLVAYFQAQAVGIELKFPRTGGLLRQLATYYESDAKKEDDRAKLHFL